IINDAEDYYKVLLKIYNLEKSKYGETDHIIQLDKNISELNSKKNEIYVQVPEIFNALSESSEEIDDHVIEKLEKEYNNANTKYNLEYNLLARQHLKTKINRYENSGDFQALCEEILPSEIFNDYNVLEKNVIEKIDKYLKDINLKNKRLNNRKLQKLATIVEEVANEVSEQRNNIRIINNFLNSDEKKITGGHKVSLEDNSEDTFSPDWMNVFT